MVIAADWPATAEDEVAVAAVTDSTMCENVQGSTAEPATKSSPSPSSRSAFQVVIGAVCSCLSTRANESNACWVLKDDAKNHSGSVADDDSLVWTAFLRNVDSDRRTNNLDC